MSETITLNLTVRQLDAINTRPRDESLTLLAIATGAGTYLEIAKRGSVPHPAIAPALRKLAADGLIAWEGERWRLTT